MKWIDNRPAVDPTNQERWDALRLLREEARQCGYTGRIDDKDVRSRNNTARARFKMRGIAYKGAQSFLEVVDANGGLHVLDFSDEQNDALKSNTERHGGLYKRIHTLHEFLTWFSEQTF